MCRDRLDTLRSELSQREEQAKQQSAVRLQSLAAETDRLEASARHEGEARCAAVQVWACCLHASLCFLPVCLPVVHQYTSRNKRSICLPACLPACLLACAVCLSVCLSVCLPACLLVLPARLPTCLPVVKKHINGNKRSSACLPSHAECLLAIGTTHLVLLGCGSNAHDAKPVLLHSP